MGLAQNYGIHFPLETAEQMIRANQLVAKNPRKFEVDAGRGRFYHYPKAGEANQIMNWVLRGEGQEPDTDLPHGV